MGVMITNENWVKKWISPVGNDVFQYFHFVNDIKPLWLNKDNDDYVQCYTWALYVSYLRCNGLCGD